eukprot:jgi/Psemu1/56683/gm1.56683_g
MPITLHTLYSCIRLFLGSATHFTQLFQPNTVQWVPPTASLKVTDTLARCYRATLKQSKMPKALAALLGELLATSVDHANISWHVAQDVIVGRYKLVAALAAFPALDPPPFPAASARLPHVPYQTALSWPPPSYTLLLPLLLPRLHPPIDPAATPTIEPPNVPYADGQPQVLQRKTMLNKLLFVSRLIQL